MQLNKILKQAVQDNSKSKNSCYYLIDAELISFFVASKGKKIQKNDENSYN